MFNSERIKELEQTVDEQKVQIEKLYDAIAKLTKETGKRKKKETDIYDERFSSLEDRFNKFEQKFEAFEKEFKTLIVDTEEYNKKEMEMVKSFNTMMNYDPFDFEKNGTVNG